MANSNTMASTFSTEEGFFLFGVMSGNMETSVTRSFFEQIKILVNHGF